MKVEGKDAGSRHKFQLVNRADLDDSDELQDQITVSARFVSLSLFPSSFSTPCSIFDIPSLSLLLLPSFLHPTVLDIPYISLPLACNRCLAPLRIEARQIVNRSVNQRPPIPIRPPIRQEVR